MPEAERLIWQSLGKSRIHLLTDWSGNGPAGQF